jgi:hypothetical protein
MFLRLCRPGSTKITAPMSPRLPEDSLPRVAISMEGRTTRTTMLAAARAMPIAIAPDWYDRAAR